eukprot:scaffold2599_cov74-Phaeocystis_antarctica.AAC.9
MGYLCAEVVLSLSSGREIIFRGSVNDDQPRFAARAREGEAIAALEFAEGQLVTGATRTRAKAEALAVVPLPHDVEAACGAVCPGERSFTNTEDSRRLARAHVDVSRPKRCESPHVILPCKRREPAHVVAGRRLVSSGLALTGRPNRLGEGRVDVSRRNVWRRVALLFAA